MIFSMDPEAIVLEISSDEEGDWKGVSGMSYDDGDGHNWLSDILDEVESRGIDDSDDVVLVGEVLPNPEKQNLKKVKSRVIDFVDDDDCVILENDPDNPTTIQNDTGDESDDVCVVSEKGQVACRDYPHSRHLCVRFPFAANSHQRHCEQCYCYVCDSLAPCVYWGNGSSKVDHCHATDKDEFWKTERKNLKKGKKEVHLNRLPQMTQVPPSSGSFQHMGVAQNHVLRPSLMHSISTPPTNPGAIPNMINQSRNRFVLPRNKFQSNLVSQQLNSSYKSNYPRDGAVHNNSSLGPRVAGVVAFKRPGSARVFPTTRCSYSSSLGNSGTRFSSRSNTFLGTSRPQAINSFDSLPSQTSVYSPQPTMRRHVQSEFSPQPGPGTLYECPGNYEYQVPPLQPLDTLFVNPIPSQSGVSPQPNGTSRVSSQQNCSVPSVPLLVPSQPNYSVPPQPQVLSQPIYSVPSQPQVLSQPIYSFPSQPQVPSQLNYSVASQTQVLSQQNYLTSVETQLPSQPNYMISSKPDSPSETAFAVSSHPLVNNESISTLNCNYQKKIKQADEPSSTDPNLTDFDLQLESIAPPTNGCALVMDSGLVDLQYDSWIFDHQPVEPGTGFTAASPEHGLIDTINIFEF